MTRPFDCSEVFRRLDDYLDRELSADEMARVAGHLETCVECALEVRFEGGVLEELRGRIRRVEVPADLKGAVLEALRRAGP